MNLRRQFDMPEIDLHFLKDYCLNWETVLDGSHWLLLHDFLTFPGYNHEKVIAAVRIQTGYPLTPLDMVYFFPALARTDGKPIPATSVGQTIDGKQFQQWSRHRTAENPWIPNVDGLESHIQLVEDWLQREFEK